MHNHKTIHIITYIFKMCMTITADHTKCLKTILSKKSIPRHTKVFT